MQLPSTPNWTVSFGYSFGSASGTAGDVNGDGYDDVIIGKKENDSIFTNNGKVYVFPGSASGLLTSPVWTDIGANEGSSYGHTVAAAGDVNGDGYDEIVVGEPGYKVGADSRGRALVYFGSSSGPSVTPSWTVVGTTTDLGRSVSSAGDVNGDGYDDVLITTAYGGLDSIPTRGAAFVYYGSASGLSSTPDWKVGGPSGFSLFGTSASTAGDVNNDGYADVIIGATNISSGTGRAYVYLGSSGGLSTTEIWTANGEGADHKFGHVVNNAGDVNGDNYDDVIVGAPDDNTDGPGKAYVFYGNGSGVSSTADWTAAGSSNSNFGQTASTCGDYNSDGFSDIIVGAPQNSPYGKAFVYKGSASGLSDSSVWEVIGDGSTNAFAFAVGTAGDVNNDGSDDVLITPYSPKAFVYHGIEENPPYSNYVPLSNSGITATRNLTGVEITDSSGVNVTPGTNPRCYFKRTTDANAFNDNTNSTDGWKYVEANGSSTPFDFTINYSMLNGGGGIIAGDVIQYFVVAQDLASVPNVKIDKGTFASIPTSVDLTSSAFPIGDPINSYLIYPVDVTGAVSGNGSYANLSSAFNSINSFTQTGADIVVLIRGNTTEPNYGCFITDKGWNTLLVKPEGGQPRTITNFSDPGLPLIRFSNGANKVTFDGLNTGGNSLTLSNTRVSGTQGTSTIFMDGGASNNTIKNCTILGSSLTYNPTIGGTIVIGPSSTPCTGNVFSYCNIGPAGPNLTMTAVYIWNPSGFSPHSQDTIRNCNIYDYFAYFNQSTGIYIGTGTTDIGIKDNKFFLTTPITTFNPAVPHSVIRIENSNGNNYDVSGNTIGYSSAGGTGNYSIHAYGGFSFTGIFLNVGTAGATNVQGNTITNISHTMQQQAHTFTGIDAASGLINIGTQTPNLIGSMSSTNRLILGGAAGGALNDILIRCAGIGNKNVSNNLIGGIIASKVSDFTQLNLTCISNTSSGTFTCQNNMIGGNVENSISASYNVEGTMELTGISSGTGTAIITGNIIKNLNANSSGQAGGSVMTTNGIKLNTNSTGNIVAQNIIHTLGITGTTGNANVVNGINMAFISPGSAIVEKNLIHSFYVPTANSIINGILMSSGTTIFKNNFIRLGITNTGSGLNTGCNIRGISETGGTNSIYFNSVYVGGNPTAGNSSTFAFQSTVTTNARNYYNNIFYNARSNNGSTGKHYSISVGGTSPNPAGLMCNYNLLYANGNGSAVGLFNGVDRLNLDLWKSSTGKDSNSVYGNPQFVNPAGDTATLNLHLGINPTPSESRGIDLPSVTEDYDGEMRLTLSPSDIGADAGNFVASDVEAPGISYSLLTGDYNLNSKSFTGVTITDSSGINVNPGLLPRCYFKRSTDANTFNNNTNTTPGWKYVEASGSTSPFDFNINYSLLNGGSANNGDTIQYFVIAQDLSFSPNVAVNSGLLASNPSSVDLSASAFPVTGTINSYNLAVVNVAGAVTGSGYYTTLGAAFSSINAGSQSSADIVINIHGNITETGAVLNSGSWSSIVISPAGGAPRTVSGTVGGTSLISLNGADNVRIDGLNTGGNSLTIENTSTSNIASTSTIRLMNEATNNVITNCNVLGSSVASYTSGAAVINFGTAASTGNNDNLISYCNIGPSGVNLPVCGVSATATSMNDTIRNCNIYDYFNSSSANSGIYLGTGTAGFSIKDNKFYQTALRTSTIGQHAAIHISNTSGHSYNISGNTIGYSSSTETGVYSYSGSSNSSFVPIYLAVGTTFPSSIQGNTFSSISITGSMGSTNPAVCFIYQNSGNTEIGNITGNLIGDMSSTENIVYSSTLNSISNIYGVYTLAGNATISNNNIGGITGSATSAACNIIAINSISSGSLTCSNNNIGGSIENSIRSTSTVGTPFVQGITASNGSLQITGNTIRNLTSASSGGGFTNATSSGGIICWNTGTHVVSGNLIFGLTNTRTSGTYYVTGIYSGTPGSNVISKNIVHSLSASSTAAVVSGIYSGAGSATFQNNMIRLGLDTSGNSINTGFIINGMAESGNPTNNFYFNSIYVGGNANIGSQNTYAFYSSVTSGLRNFKNNIFYNARTNTVSLVKNYGIRLGGAGASVGCDYNIIYAPNSGGVVGFLNSVDYPNIGAWRLATGKDSNSYSTNPQYINPTGSASNFNLRIANSPTHVEQGGILIGSVTEDFDGELRTNLTPTDIGADAGNFTMQSTPLNGDYTVGLSLFNSIGGTNVYFEKTLRKVKKEVEEDEGRLNERGEPVRKIMIKEVEEETLVPMENGKIYTGPLFKKRDANPNLPMNAMAGVYANINSALNDLYSSGASGPVRLMLLDASYTESLPLLITDYQGASSVNTLIIKPASGVTSTISGVGFGNTFDINGGNYFTLDGSNAENGVTKNLTVSNSSNSNSVIRFLNDANHNVVKNCALKGVTTLSTSGVVFMSTTNKASGNDSNLILNNEITKNATSPVFCFYNAGTGTSSATKNTGNRIIGNSVYDFSSRGIVDEGNSAGTLYEGNEIYSLTSQSGFLVGCRIVGTNIEGFTFRNNYIHDLKTNATNIVYGLEVNNIQSSFTGEIYNNFISLSEPNSNDIRGINESCAGTATINIFHNSVNISGTVSGVKNSQCIYRTTGSICNFKNNILVNSRNGGSGKHYAIRTNSPLNTLSSNYNDIYAGGGIGNVFGITDGTERLSLADWQTATGSDSNSVSANPFFISNVNLHIDSTQSSPVSNAGVPIAGITTDFDYNIRSLTNPDIGADEFVLTILSIDLDLTMLIEGFYNPSTDLQVSDSIKVYLRNSASPYAAVDSAMVVVSDSGKASMTFTNAASGNYFIQINHRNAIEIWSANAVSFTQGGTTQYDFTSAASQAFGDNLKQVDASPVKFATYSGDVNQDGVIDASDNGAIDNDASNFASGYLSTDLNGDEVIDASDAAIADNNAANFVSKVTP